MTYLPETWNLHPPATGWGRSRRTLTRCIRCRWSWCRTAGTRPRTVPAVELLDTRTPRASPGMTGTPSSCRSAARSYGSCRSWAPTVSWRCRMRGNGRQVSRTRSWVPPCEETPPRVTREGLDTNIRW